MASYSQRFKKYHDYCSNHVEDILAVTLCLPFTFALHLMNSIADLVSDLPYVPNGLDSLLWRPSRFLLTMPLYTLKGIVGLTIVPFIAAILAAMNKQLPPPSKFKINQYFQIMFLSGLLRIITFFVLPRFNPLMYLIGFLMQFFIFPSVILILPPLASILLQLDDTISLFAAISPFFQPLGVFLVSAPLSVLFPLGLLASFAWLQGQYSVFSQLFARGLNAVISFAQNRLLRRGFVPFNNKTDITSDEEIKNLAADKIFVTNTNYALDLDGLELGVKEIELVNYNYPKDNHGKHPAFDYDDVLRLEKIVSNQQQQFPQLVKYIQEHKKDYLTQQISNESFALLETFANKMNQAQSNANFDEEFLAAKGAFEAHLAKISPEERNYIENLNLIGGMDDKYKLKQMLENVYNGTSCKKGVSRLIKETIERKKSNEKGDDVALFYHKAHPTHWIGTDFLMR